MDEDAPDVPDAQAVVGVAAALIDTVGGPQAAAILHAQYGWDITVQAVAHVRGDHVRGDEAGRALHHCVALLLVSDA
ncbi:hypothetical protein [Euzebya sp.]|uniref:hypothetical protein n=1 Tax=Euzebya sp. TaxID=1971409 RepID=UPI0035192191